MRKSKKLQYLFLISGVVLGLVSCEVEASSNIEEAFLPVQGILFHNSMAVNSEENNEENHTTSIDDTVEIPHLSKKFDFLPQTGESDKHLPLLSGLIILLSMMLLAVKNRKVEDKS